MKMFKNLLFGIAVFSVLVGCSKDDNDGSKITDNPGSGLRETILPLPALTCRQDSSMEKILIWSCA